MIGEYLSYNSGFKRYSLKRDDGIVYEVSGDDKQGFEISEVTGFFRTSPCIYFRGDSTSMWDEVGKFDNFIHAVRFLRENIEYLDRMIDADVPINWYGCKTY